ncbi:ABC transporter substrate-binding protein [Parasalinivibrio latis]
MGIRQRHFLHFAVTFFAVLCLSLSPTLRAETIKIGMSTALAGPAKGLGKNVKAGVESYFKMINEQGGVNGHTLELIALNDGYEPDRAARNMRKLIEKEKVSAVIGNVGTPTAVVTVPLANQLKTPLVGAITGAGLLRNTPPDRYVINYRASYAQETAAMIEGLLKSGIKPEEIAFFTQQDGYGKAGYDGAVKALKAKGFDRTASLAHGRYLRNTSRVEKGLTTILNADVKPKAIIMVGAYKPCAKFIKLAKQKLPDALYLNVSFVGSIPLLKELGKNAEGVIVTQVVPHYQSDLPGVREYREAFAKYSKGTPASFLSLEGYLAAKILVMGIEKAGNSVTSETIVDGLHSLNVFDLGIDTALQITADSHQASNRVWPTQIQDGQYVTLNWDSL